MFLCEGTKRFFTEPMVFYSMAEIVSFQNTDQSCKSEGIFSRIIKNKFDRLHDFFLKWDPGLSCIGIRI